MQFFKNRHIVTSLIMAPILALISYFSIDYIVKEKPHIAKNNTSYVMRAKSNCRWGSGRCDLENNDVKLKITAIHSSHQDNTQLKLVSNIKLSNVQVSIVSKQGNITKPQPMLETDKNIWNMDNSYIDPNSFLQLAVMASNSIFYAEVSTIFTQLDKL